MSHDDYACALDAACREYESLQRERAAIDLRLARVTATISTLSKLCGYEPTVPLGLTDACRMVLRGAGRPLTPVEVRDKLASFGLDLDRYANALSAIHTVLKRMVEGGEAGTKDRDDTERLAYEFLGTGLIASRVGPPQLAGSSTRRPPHAPRRKAAK
jgi:hypothetical protein